VEAYERLSQYANVSKTWGKQYFRECQKAIEANLSEAIKSDAKYIRLGTHKQYVGQMTVWSGQVFVKKYAPDIAAAVPAKQSHWFINVISISEKRSFFVASNNATKERLEALLNVRFVGNIATADRLWLRKEIVKKEREVYTK
jgi:inorganic pyrophosphatase/manganese-dependent inorganic pyrophosphatase